MLEKVFNIKWITRDGVYTSIDFDSKEEALKSLKEEHNEGLSKASNEIELVCTETFLIKGGDES